jgi:hypothetical protein
MKAIWKGYLKCSLVTIPVRLYSVTTKHPRHPRQFHFYCQKGDFLRNAEASPPYRDSGSTRSSGPGQIRGFRRLSKNPT